MGSVRTSLGEAVQKNRWGSVEKSFGGRGGSFERNSEEAKRYIDRSGSHGDTIYSLKNRYEGPRGASRYTDVVGYKVPAFLGPFNDVNAKADAFK